VSALGGRSVRFVVGFALLVVGLVEVYMLLVGARSQRRLRMTTIGRVRAEVALALPALLADLGPGGRESWNAAAHRAVESGLATEVEVWEAGGEVLLSRPTVAPVGHRPDEREAAELRSGAPVAALAQAGPVARALTYVPFQDGGRRLLLRLSTPVPDLERDLLERQNGFVAHLAALSVLLLAAVLVFFAPARPREPPPTRALDAYEEAMERLRDRGEELTREHVAERRRMEGELREQAAMARAGELTAGIVHEVRNGLGTILGYARMLERDAPGPEVVEAARSIREECETLEAVIRRFMQFVRQETLTVAPFDLVRLLSRVAARESRGRPGADVVLRPPEIAGPVRGDEELLERALENLVRNGREAAGGRGHVWVSAAADAGTVTITIEDDGPGLPPESRDRPRPFFTTKPGGLGLGLPIAFKIIRLHEGELAFEDRAPRGLRAMVRLPAAGPRGA